eukprot:Nitzschia sp. Nitz4//scaffold97_size77645//25227//25757//NITZ4_005514-RA/size77645-exonerate_protein2genome-gene-0.3-mRNA-1//-1//CDS//3329560644//9297//frame0
MTVRKVVFVDIDGVLLPFPHESQGHLFPNSTLVPLKRLWEYVTTRDPSVSVEWVLSSTWRVKASFIRDIEQALHEFGIPIVFADITDPALHSERQWEIYEWLATQSKKQTDMTIQRGFVWLALDDEELILEEKNEEYRDLFEGHVIQTHSTTGLSQGNVDRAIELWEQQLNNNIAS